MADVFVIETTHGESRGDYPGIDKAIALHHRARVTIEDFTKVEISDAQRSWVHCKAGPIQELMREGWSFREAKEHIKVEYGRQWFVVELTDDNFKKIDGVFRWECRKSMCRKLIHPMNINVNYDRIRCCPYCDCPEGTLLRPIAIKSIMDVSVKNTNLWFDEIFAHFPKNPDGSARILQPDPDWKKKPENKT